MASHIPRSGRHLAALRFSALLALVASLAVVANRSQPFVAPSQANARGRGTFVPKSATLKQDIEVDAIADGRIFVSIAAYADPELPSTMMSLLHAAERPELIRFGIVWQGPGSGFAAEDLSELAKLWNAEEVNERFVTDLQLPHGSVPVWEMLDGRVRSIRMPAEDARGPCWARYLAQLLWEKEELQLQLDSHMRFVPGWDSKARAELNFCSQTSEKPILCSYGAGYSLGTPYWETPQDSSQSVNCANTFDSDGILLIKARELKAPLDQPRKHYFWGAQFSFSTAEVLCEVPYDPQLQMLFFGEEILMAVRFFTHGWDVFTPKEQLFFHLWERDYRRVYWKDNRELFASLLKESQCRVLSQLERGSAAASTEQWPLPGGGVSNPEKDHFSLGMQRTLEDYQVASGVDFRAKRLEARALRGGDHHREADFKEAMVLQKPPLKLSAENAELQGIAGATFISDALVNDRSSYVAQRGSERFVLWYSTTNQTWLLNAGGVAHGLGQEARPVLFSEPTTGAEPTDVRQWYYFDAYMRRWSPSRSLHFQLKEEEEEEEEAQSWWNALLKPVPLVELR